MDLYDILACPTCKVSVHRQDDHLACPRCGRTYPIVNGTPVLLPDGSIPSTEYQHDLKVRPTYDPWIPRLVMQSLPASAHILDIGAGNLTLNLPNVIRMDVTLTPYVDVVGDAHMMPFLPGTFDLVFSLAVIEHLRQPFVAAQEMYDVLRNGGYVYGECNFVFAYHGYPHHYFNASEQGLEQVFAPFEKFRTGVAPYQMPSEAIRMLFITYLNSMSKDNSPDVARFRTLIREVLDQPLGTYDGLFTEDEALKVAAGVFFFGRKSLGEPTEVVPRAVQTVWEENEDVKSLFPNLFDIGSLPNVMLWAKGEGREQFRAIDDYFRNLVPFRKSPSVDDTGQKAFDALPILPPVFGNIADPKPPEPVSEEESVLQQRLGRLAARNNELEDGITEQIAYIKHLSRAYEEKLAYIERLESLLRERDAQLKAVQSPSGRGRFSRLTNLIRPLQRG